MKKKLVVISVDKTNNDKVLRLMVRSYPNKVAGSFDWYGRTTTVQVTGITDREVRNIKATLDINLEKMPPVKVIEIKE